MKIIPNNAENVKILNRKNIVTMIRQEPTSRAKLAVKTGLTRAAITFIVNDLIEQGIVYDLGTLKSNVGRHPILLDVNADYGYFAGVLLERNGYSVCITDFKAQIKASNTIDLSECKTTQESIDKISDEILKLLASAKISKDKLMGVGISSPGPVDYHTGTILNPPAFDAWHNVPVAEMLNERLGVPAWLENTSVALAVAEYRYGISSNFHSSLFLKIDKGLGSALIIGGNIFRGARGTGVEIGHCCVNVDGPKCQCGNNGCLEGYASMKSLFELFPQADIKSWDNVIHGYTKGDEVCTKIFEHEIKYLSAGIANAVNLYDLDGVIISPNFAFLSEVFVAELSKAIERLSVVSRIHPIQIKIATFSKQADLRAAAVTAIENCF